MGAKKLQKRLSLAIILSEMGHVFCCVLPSIFSVLSVFVSAGVISVMPPFMAVWHEAIHKWEIPIILFSGTLLLLGWALHSYSQKIDCHDTGCHHPPCTPKKTKSSKLLMVATALFAVNVLIYLSIHAGG
ncbi:MAG: hypothetical protein HND56_01095 [Pseudomonadota bacterium]|nr:hypothetical protein [Pseudomonadota bacterium]QKK04362.1 MAG: hypothetical protein HND56_01095 [Pseudomonadota bacterium]|tara:strand:- start:2 stop:391 length:390 start_codon:yes stop_codon:yes gene_type:complete